MNKLMIRHTMDKPLPYDAEVEYLESSGTQYINTGITCNTDTDVLQVKFSISSFVSFCGVAGYRVGASDHNFAIGYNQSNAMSADCNNSNYANSRALISDAVANTDYTIIISRQGRYIYKGDSLVDSNTSTSDIFTTGDIYIFAVNGIQNYSQIKVKSFQIERNGVTIMDLMPVRKGNTGYLYDKVSGRLFGNQGTGDFVVGPDYNPFAYQYLTFVPLEDSTFSFSKRGTGNDIEYSIDGGAWTSLASEANTPTVGAGHNIRWRAELVPSTAAGIRGIGTFSASGLYDAMGNTMSLLYGDNYIGQTTLVGTYTFCNLWREDSHIYRADRMVLPTMSLSIACYNIMFYKCTSLVTAPELPATTLAAYCYDQMFSECTSLIAASKLPATTLAPYCYQNMFNRCVSLKQPPELYATTLTTSCYNKMFRGCKSLTTIPELPATTLVGNCYYQMFLDCKSLTTIPKLQATELAANCYYQMFNGCTSLTTVLGLPATILKNQCYSQMFIHCSSLSYIKCLATDISASNCTYNWLSDVPSTGTFVKAAGMEDWATGASGIPSGWTVVDDNSTINS